MRKLSLEEERIVLDVFTLSVADFLEIRNQHRPSLPDLDRLIACVGLNVEWQDKLKRRRTFLAKLGQPG